MYTYASTCVMCVYILFENLVVFARILLLYRAEHLRRMADNLAKSY